MRGAHVAKVINNSLAAGLPILLAVAGLLLVTSWLRRRERLSHALAGAGLTIAGALMLVNSRIVAHGRFLGQHTWGPKNASLEALTELFLFAACLILAYEFLPTRERRAWSRVALVVAGLASLFAVLTLLGLT